MKSHGGVEVWLHSFLTLVLSGGKVVTITPQRLWRWRKMPRYPVSRRLGGPIYGLDYVERKCVGGETQMPITLYVQ